MPVTDSQVVKTTPVGGPQRGYDGAKRHILVDTMSKNYERLPETGA
jgi:hypothetical protein